MSDTISIAVRVLDELERHRIISMFDVMSPQLNERWVLTPTNAADVVMLDIDEPGSDSFLATCREIVAALPLLVGHSNTLSSEWFLEKPVRVNQLVPLLNDLGRYMRMRSQRPRPALETRPDPNNDYHNVQRMFELMRAQPGCYRIEITPTCPIYFDSANDKILLPHQLVGTGNRYDAIHLVAHSVRQRNINAIPTERFKSVSNDKRFALFSREALIWTWCLNSSAVQVPEATDSTRYHLARWPNLLGIPHTSSHLKLCQYLSHHNETLAVIAAETRIPIETVAAFCNACDTLGLMKIERAGDSGFLSQPHSNSP